MGLWLIAGGTAQPVYKNDAKSKIDVNPLRLSDPTKFRNPMISESVMLYFYFMQDI